MIVPSEFYSGPKRFDLSHNQESRENFVVEYEVH